MTYAQFRSFFAAMRAAFDGFACERRAIVSEGEHIGSRTCMSGPFTTHFEASPIGTIAPNEQPMRLELINLFRHHENGQLAEERVQYDSIGFLRQLGIALTEGR